MTRPGEVYIVAILLLTAVLTTEEVVFCGGAV
jgi:hypothetical protein